MSESKKPQVSEQEARAVAEGARETTWEAPSFVRELFLGKLDLGLIHPWHCPAVTTVVPGRADPPLAHRSPARRGSPPRSSDLLPDF